MVPGSTFTFCQTIRHWIKECMSLVMSIADDYNSNRLSMYMGLHCYCAAWLGSSMSRNRKAAHNILWYCGQYIVSWNGTVWSCMVGMCIGIFTGWLIGPNLGWNGPSRHGYIIAWTKQFVPYLPTPPPPPPKKSILARHSPLHFPYDRDTRNG